MHSAEQFLDLLEKKDLLAPAITRELREEVLVATEPLDAVALAHRLVREGHLTPPLAERLLATIGEQFKPAAPAAKPADAKKSPPATSPPKAETKKQKKTPPSPPPASTTDTGPAGGHALPEALPAGPMHKPPKGAALGPLDALMASEGMDEPVAGSLMTTPPPRKRSLRRFLRNLKKLFRRKRSKTVVIEAADPRQVKILLATWGGAILLLAVACGLFWYFTPPSPDELFRRADVAYDTGNYAEAADVFQRYVDQFPDRTNASTARVHLGVAQLHVKAQEAQQSGDWSAAFRFAQELMRKLPSEAAFQESPAKKEVGVALAAIGEGLATRARDNPEPAVVENAQMIVGMIEMNIPERARPGEMLSEINRRLEPSLRHVASDRELTETLAAIQEALAKGDVIAAYVARNAVVRHYPDLASDRRLEDALATAARMQQAAVKMVQRREPAMTAERPTDVLAAVAIAQRTLRGEVAEGRGRCVFAAAEGAVYGLDATNGKVLWRRFVAVPSGQRALAMLPPLPLSQEPGEDVILTDLVHNEILRVEAATGRLLWRHAMPQPITAEPVRGGNRLFVPTENGSLVLVDLLSGDSPGCVQLPQPFHVSPVADAERSLLFQPADLSNLFVLSSGDGACRQVFHLGHGADTIGAPPVLAGDFLLVAVNDAPKDSTLHVLAIEPAGAAPGGATLKAVQQVRIHGHVKTPPLARGKQVLVVTTQGALQVFKFTGANSSAPLESVARSEFSGDEERVRYPAARANRFWVADAQLARYEIQSGTSRLVPRQITDRGFNFVQPLVTLGQVMYHVRQKPGMPGVTVSAVDLEKREAVWQTWLAAPLCGEPVADPAGGRLIAVTAIGGTFRFEAAALKGQTVADQPAIELEATKLMRPIHDMTPMPGGVLAMTDGPGAKQVMLYDPQEPERRYRWLLLPAAMACPPLPFAGGLLAPCSDGHVFLVDLKSSGNLAKPFEPSLKSLTAWNWSQPAACGEKDALLCDGDQRLYRLHVEGPPDAELMAAAETRYAKTIATPVAVTGKTAYLVDMGGVAVAFELPTLVAGKSQPLSGHPAWGPSRIGSSVLVATDKSRLYCFNDQQQLVWEAALPYGPLAGAPLLADDHYLLASRDGVVWRIAAATGAESGKVDAGCPLATGPVLLGSRLLVGGRDGSIYEVKRP